MTRWGMVIDLKRCIGCSACTVGCKAENGTRPGILWNEVFDWVEGSTYLDVERKFLPRPCMQCNDAPCVNVCPTGATFKSADRITQQDYSTCIGCRYCMAACPYGARYFNNKSEGYFDVYGDGSPGLSPYEEVEYQDIAPSGQKHVLGVVEKCIFCTRRVDEGIKNGLDPAVDWDARPACINACPTGARTFGDLDNPDSEVSRQIRGSVGGRHGQQLRPEMNTSPNVYYLPR